MKSINKKELISSWKREEEQPFTGWDFSYLDDRMLEEHPPWGYLRQAKSWLFQPVNT